MKRNKAIWQGALKLCPIMMLIIAAFAAYFSISLGWFAKNDSVRATEMNVSLALPMDVSADVEVYAFENKTGNELVFSAENINTGEDVIKLPEYTILEDRCYLLMKISIINQEDFAVRLTAKTETDYFMDADRPLLGTPDGKPAEDDTTTAWQNCLSSIIAFGTVNEVVSDESSHTITMPVMTPMAVESNGEMMIQNTIELKNSITEGEETEVWILISYDEMNINRVYSANIGNDAMAADGTEKSIIFVSDVTFALIPDNTA